MPRFSHWAKKKTSISWKKRQKTKTYFKLPEVVEDKVRRNLITSKRKLWSVKLNDTILKIKLKWRYIEAKGWVYYFVSKYEEISWVAVVDKSRAKQNKN